jgi:methyl-accepting chemotaxis protein
MSINRRKTRVVYPDFQYRNALMTVAAVIFILNFFLIIGAVFADSTKLALTISNQGYYFVGVFELIVMAAAWFYSIRHSHTIAGPIYAITRDLERVGSGDLTVQIKLRPGDKFQESADKINFALNELCNTVSQIKNMATSIDVASLPELEVNKYAELKKSLAQIKTDQG